MTRTQWTNVDTDVLFRALAHLKNMEEVRSFCRDLMTEKEIVEFGHRFKAARMLSAGVPYVEIAKATGMSSTTIARVKKWLDDGMGGYRLALSRTR